MGTDIIYIHNYFLLVQQQKPIGNAKIIQGTLSVYDKSEQYCNRGVTIDMDEEYHSANNRGVFLDFISHNFIILHHNWESLYNWEDLLLTLITCTVTSAVHARF